MRFLTTVRSVDTGAQPPVGLMQAMEQLIKDGLAAGALYETGGLAPAGAGKFYRIAKGKLQVHDGPFAESKEVVGGYAILECASREEAERWATRFMQLHVDHWPEWEGASDLREMQPMAGTNVRHPG